jgi:ectoine hydroxylase
VAELTSAELGLYRELGYLLRTNVLPVDVVASLKAELPPTTGESPDVVLEENGAVRSVYGTHAHNPAFAALCRRPEILRPAMQIVGSAVYVYQFKINFKAAFDGDVWKWHQDYIFWRDEDSLPAPRVTTVAIFLDEVNEFNAPLMLIPGSHAEGVVQVRPPEDKSGPYPWSSDLSARLKFALPDSTVKRLAERGGITAAKGPPGSVLFLDSNLVHGSSANLSPFDRVVAFITYNSVDNLPAREPSRPEFLVARDCRPLLPS